MTTEVNEFITDLDGGVFEGKLSRILSEVAAAAIDTDKGGEVNVSLKIARIGSSYQVGVESKLSFKKPTKRGKVSEEETTQTPMYVGERGKMSLFPDNQDQLFDRIGGVIEKAQTGE